MVKWKFSLYDEDNPDACEVLTEQEIFEREWNKFYNNLYDDKYKNNPNVIRLKTLPLALQRQACIDEYIVVNWGWKVDE